MFRGSLIEQQAAYFLNTPKHDGHPLLSSIQHYLKLKLPASKQKVVLFHYPMAEWDGCHHGWYHLYGHLHDRVAPVNGRLLNVGWDLHGRFLSVTDIDQLLSQEPIIQPFL